ncbi:hypothetical protein BT93_H2302 [Corymbia citriodora subsp. variegata]|nr:hypothetical protein BT93_H2302 [Corymbia citriodora subsp. variegata]
MPVRTNATWQLRWMRGLTSDNSFEDGFSSSYLRPCDMVLEGFVPFGCETKKSRSLRWPMKSRRKSSSTMFRDVQKRL